MHGASIVIWGAVGFIIGASISYKFILPPVVFNMKFDAMTIGNFLQIVAALFITVGSAVTGGILGSSLSKPD